jgi:hypothetical protein
MLDAVRTVANPNNESPAQLIAGALEKGLPIDLAVERAGICRKTWYNWIERAEAGDPE